MTEKKKQNIYQKLIEVRKKIGTLNKDTSGYGFKYVSGSQVLGKIKEEMDKQGIILEPHLISPRMDKDGGYIDSPMKMIWINADDPKDRSEVAWYMIGKQRDPSQAFGSGLTYSERYFIMKYFNVPTDEDDPDSRSSKQDKPEKKESGADTEYDHALLNAFSDPESKTAKAFVKSIENLSLEEQIQRLKAKAGN